MELFEEHLDNTAYRYMQMSIYIADTSPLIKFQIRVVYIRHGWK